jgi:hypothetical protein
MHGISFTRGVREINHSQFADDMFLLGATSIIISKIFKKVIKKFLNASKEKVNNLKSKIYGWNISLEKLQAI